MLRTAVAATGAVLAATCALSACAPVHMGAAAIVGGQRITSATLASQVSDVTGTFHAGKGKVALQFPASELPREVLGWLLRFRVREDLATLEHVSVSQAETQQALNSIAAQAAQGGAGSIPLRELAAANGLPPDLLSELGRYQAIETAVIKHLDGGTMPTAQAALQALSIRFNHVQCLAAKRLSISVNPQFGSLDYSQLAVVPAPDKLSAPTSGPAKGATQPTPHC